MWREGTQPPLSKLPGVFIFPLLQSQDSLNCPGYTHHTRHTHTHQLMCAHTAVTYMHISQCAHTHPCTHTYHSCAHTHTLTHMHAHIKQAMYTHTPMHIHTPRHTAVLQPHTPVCTHTHTLQPCPHTYHRRAHTHTRKQPQHVHTPHNRAHTPRHTHTHHHHHSFVETQQEERKGEGGRIPLSPSLRGLGRLFSVYGGKGAVERNCRFSCHPRACAPASQRYLESH